MCDQIPSIIWVVDQDYVDFSTDRVHSKDDLEKRFCELVTEIGDRYRETKWVLWVLWVISFEISRNTRLSIEGSGLVQILNGHHVLICSLTHWLTYLLSHFPTYLLRKSWDNFVLLSAPGTNHHFLIKHGECEILKTRKTCVEMKEELYHLSVPHFSSLLWITPFISITLNQLPSRIQSHSVSYSSLLIPCSPMKLETNWYTIESNKATFIEGILRK
jgi:hypothetical protein